MYTFYNAKHSPVELPDLLFHALSSGIKFVDSHTHLDMLEDVESAEILQLEHVLPMLDICEDEYRSTLSQDWSAFARQINYAAGCHPHNAKDFSPGKATELADLAAGGQIAVIGEIGLDFHYDHSPRDVQVDVFMQQLEIAKRYDLPVSLHIREAEGQAIEILRNFGPVSSAPSILHCCTITDAEILQQFLDLELNLDVAYGGAFTFNNAGEIRQTSQIVPIERLLCETDAPFMTPVPLRGRKCWPGDVLWNYYALAQSRGIENPDDFVQFCGQILDNYQKIIRITH